MTTTADFFAAGLEQVKRSWSWFLVLGISLTILGVLCVGMAQTATTFSILALGWILAISGVMWLVNAFRAFSWDGFFLFLLNAIIRGVTGYLLLRHPDAGAVGVTLLLASLFIVADCSAQLELVSCGSQGEAGWSFRELYPLCLVSQYWSVGLLSPRTLLGWRSVSTSSLTVRR
jgi:uncharacterized membrane protein HdeD (DUF308 family)